MLEFPADKSTPPRKEPWTVTRLNREVRSYLESRLGAVWVIGEISNLRRQPSGHSYFSLKDESCQVSCVMFRGAAPGAAALRDGMQVEIFGEIGVYEPRGQYQIIVRRAQARGTGELEAKLRALHEKLRDEGLFDQDRKRALPPHPVRVGVVTSPAGAAIRDFLHILARRAPHIEVFIAPVRVQGKGAAAEIALAVSQFADPVHSGFPAVDVIVVTRGGGSLEDLWEFNEETVARAIAASAIPVISAVGHETDVTTSDLVADVRAPTPSAAAEILSSDRAETFKRLAYLLGRMERETSSRLELGREQLRRCNASGAFASPRRRVADLRLLADDLSERSILAVGRRLALLREGTLRARSILRARSPASQLATLRERLGALDMRRAKAVASELQMRRQLHARLRHELELLGPRQTLARGFTVTMDAERRAITSAETAAKQPELIILFADGEVISHPE